MAHRLVFDSKFYSLSHLLNLLPGVPTDALHLGHGQDLPLAHLLEGIRHEPARHPRGEEGPKREVPRRVLALVVDPAVHYRAPVQVVLDQDSGFSAQFQN